jgi:hypothetical protein
MNQKILIPVFVLMAVLFGACGVNINLNVDKGSGNIITQTRDVTNFDKIALNGIGDLTITQGDREGLEIEAEDNVIPHILTQVKNGTLTISFDNKTIVPTKSIKFRVSMRTIHGMETQGVSNIQSDQIKTDRLEIGISGTGNINLRNLEADQLDANVSGAGNFTAVGKVNGQKITMSGAGNFNGEDMQSKTADINITGLGRVVAWVTDTLNVTISGTGGVDYYGSPQVSQQISGLGKIQSKGNK